MNYITNDFNNDSHSLMFHLVSFQIVCGVIVRVLAHPPQPFLNLPPSKSKIVNRMVSDLLLLARASTASPPRLPLIGPKSSLSPDLRRN